MKVVEIVYNCPAETFIQRHVRALQEMAFPVQVVARHGHLLPKDSASFGDLDLSLSMDIMPNFNHFAWTSKLSNLRCLTKTSLQVDHLSWGDKVLLSYFERLKPDLIHFHDASLAASMGWIPNALRIPYTLSLRGSDIQVLPLRSSTQREAILTAITGAAKVHAVCDALGRHAANMLGCDLDYSVIYTALPIASALPGWKSTRSGEQVHFVTSGRLVWRKRFDNLLIALHHLRDRGMDARLTIIGVGPDLDHLLYLRNSLGLDAVVDFPGKLTYKQIQDVFHCAQAYIQSSVAEGLSNSLVEAIASGLPVFATDVDGTREVIEDGATGFLLSPLSSPDWVEKLIQIYDVALMERVRASAYQKAKQYFSAERHARAFISFFADAQNSKSQSVDGNQEKYSQN